MKSIKAPLVMKKMKTLFPNSNFFELVQLNVFTLLTIVETSVYTANSFLILFWQVF